jgi:hypothetical protein
MCFSHQIPKRNAEYAEEKHAEDAVFFLPVLCATSPSSAFCFGIALFPFEQSGGFQPA